MEHGLYITLSGGETGGKSTQAKLLEKFFIEQKVPLMCTREPGGTEIGSKIRRILLDPANEDLSPLTTMLLYQADRAQLSYGLEIPQRLARGESVLSDRCFLETEVYQGIVEGVDRELIDYIRKVATQEIMPDLAIIIDGDPEEMQTNAQREWGEMDRYDRKNLDFHYALRQGFLDIAKKYPEFTLVIPYQGGSPDLMQQQMQELIQERFGERMAKLARE